MGERIGHSVQRARKQRGLTQIALAQRAHVSLSLVKKVEQGKAPATPAFVSAVSQALRVPIADLTGQPYLTGDRSEDSVHDLISDLRRELSSYGLPPEHEPAQPSMSALARRVAECSGLVHDAGYARLGTLLPPLLGDLNAAAFVARGADRARVMLMLSETYDNAKRLAYDLGYGDLGMLAVSLEERAAEEAGDPLAVATATSVRAWSLTTAGSFGNAYRVLTG